MVSQIMSSSTKMRLNYAKARIIIAKICSAQFWKAGFWSHRPSSFWLFPNVHVLHFWNSLRKPVRKVQWIFSTFDWLFFSLFQEFPVFWPVRETDFELETFRVRFVDEAVHEGMIKLFVFLIFWRVFFHYFGLL